MRVLQSFSALPITFTWCNAMIAANLPVSKDCCNNVLKPVNTFGQTKLDLNLWRESLASHPSLDILIFVLGRSKPGQKCVFSGGNGVRQKSGFYTLAFWDREQLTRGRGNLVVNLQLHLGLERLCQYIPALLGWAALFTFSLQIHIIHTFDVQIILAFWCKKVLLTF